MPRVMVEAWFRLKRRGYGYIPSSKAGWLVTLITGFSIGLATALFVQVTTRLGNLLTTVDLLLIFGLYFLVVTTNVAALVILIKLTSGQRGHPK